MDINASPAAGQRCTWRGKLESGALRRGGWKAQADRKEAIWLGKNSIIGESSLTSLFIMRFPLSSCKHTGAASSQCRGTPMLPLTPEKIVDVTLTLAFQGKASCRRELRAQLTGFQHRLKERGIVCHLRGSFVIPAQPLRGFTDVPREQRAFHRKEGGHSQTLYAFYLILAINPFPAVIYDDFLPECPRIYFYFEDLQNHPVSSPNRAMLHAGAGRSQPSCNEGVLQHKR